MSKIKSLLFPVLIILLAFSIFITFQYGVKRVTVSGASMQPNLQDKEQVMVLPWAHINRLSVIVFNAHGEDPMAHDDKDYYVKRVIGLPGDSVSFENNKLYVNNKVVDQSFISKSEQSNGTSVQGSNLTSWNIKQLAKKWPSDKNAVKVPQGKYFVLGDHRSVSNDSRYWGFVPKNKILGVVHTFPWSTNETERRNVNDFKYKTIN